MSSAPRVAPPRPSSNGAVHAQLPQTGSANGAIRYKDSDAHALWAVVSLMLGILVAVLGFFALMMWVDAHNAKDAANRAAAKVSKAAPSASSDLGALKSYAGATPSNADALAAAHKPFPAALPAAPAGPVAHVNLVLTDITVQIAPGVK
jgi:hypothetical protein